MKKINSTKKAHFFPSLEKLRVTKAQSQEILKKWKNTGLLKGVDKDKQIILAWLLENQEKMRSIS